MNRLLLGLSSISLVVGMNVGVLAADYGTPMMAEPGMMTGPGFDWDGVYAGVFGGGSVDAFGAYALGGGAAGAIFTLTDDWKVNVEGSVGLYTGASSGWEAEVSGRLGYAIDDVMLYGMGAIGSDTGSPYFSAGMGVWFAATDNVSLRLEADANSYFGSGVIDWYGVTGGAFWHFD